MIARLILFVLVLTHCAQAQCTIDPATGQWRCAPAREAPVAPLPARCRVRVGDGSTGSGSLVTAEHVLTCAHLFDRCEAPIEITFADGRRCAGRLALIDRAHDLAAIQIAPCDIAPLPLAPQITSQLVVGGFGADGRFAAARGRIIGWAQPAGARFACAVLDVPARPGDSGGAVIDLRRQLVGVVWGSREGRSYVTCGRPLADFLARLRAGRWQPAPETGPTDQPTSTPPRDDALEARLRALEERVAAWPSTQPPIDHRRLAQQLAPHLPPIHMRVLDARGPEFSTHYQAVRLGQFVTLPFGPHEPLSEDHR